MNYSAYYSNVDITTGVVLSAVVLSIIKLLIPLESTQDTPSRTYYGRCFKISHFRVIVNYDISKINYEITQPSEQVANQFLLFCFIVKYLFSTLHVIGDFKKQVVKATDYSLLK